MTSAHIAPHVENLGSTISQFHGHIESGHEAPHDGICDAANNYAIHFLQLAAQAKKSFPEAERQHFYVDLNKEVKTTQKATLKFNEMKPTFVAQGINCSDVVLAMEGAMIAMIAMFDILKAADPKYEGHIETSFKATMQSSIDTYSNA